MLVQVWHSAGKREENGSTQVELLSSNPETPYLSEIQFSHFEKG